MSAYITVCSTSTGMSVSRFDVNFDGPAREETCVLNGDFTMIHRVSFCNPTRCYHLVIHEF